MLLISYSAHVEVAKQGLVWSPCLPKINPGKKWIRSNWPKSYKCSKETKRDSAEGEIQSEHKWSYKSK